MRALLLALFILIPALSWATPPRSVFVDEKLFAINSTHIFVLRTLSDNFGFYEVNQSDVTLIARNRDTGKDDQHWPVLSIRDKGATFEEFEPDQDRVANLGLPERVNPYDIVLWRKARLPINAGNIYDPSVFRIANGDIRFDDIHASFTARLSDVQASLDESLQASRATIPFNPDAGLSTGTIEMAKIDPLFRWPLQLSDRCHAVERHNINSPAPAASRQFAIKLDCGQDEQSFAIFVILNLES